MQGIQRVRCKLEVRSITQFQDPAGTGQVTLSAVYENCTTGKNAGKNGCEENHVFGEYTPCAEFKASILNPAAFAMFRQALDEKLALYLDFTPAVTPTQE